MSRQIYVCLEDTHSKYWIIDQDKANPAIVLVRNGRLGSPKGAVQPERYCGDDWDAQHYISSKIAEKRRKGYIQVDEHKFKQLTIQASVVGLSNKLESMTWMEYIISNGTHIPVQEDRLIQPDYNPALMVVLQTKKSYGGQNSFLFLFTPDKSYYVPGAKPDKCVRTTELVINTTVPIRLNLTEITKDNPLYEISNRVEMGLAAVFN